MSDSSLPIPSPAGHELAGQVAVVTGSSSGIGRAIAVELAAAGADVIVHARARREPAEETAAAIRKLGRQARVVLADLADPANHERLVAECWNWTGGVDVWVNNAGADVLTGDTADGTFEQKLEAFACFETERRDYPHPRNDRALRAHAEFYGATVGCEYAEPFVLVRNVS